MQSLHHQYISAFFFLLDNIHSSYMGHPWCSAVQVTQQELVENQVAGTATVLAFVWTPHWDLCDLNTPSTINKRGDFTLLLATEINMYIRHVHLLPSYHFWLVGEVVHTLPFFWRR